MVQSTDIEVDQVVDSGQGANKQNVTIQVLADGVVH